MKKLSLITVTFFAVCTLSPQMFAAKPTTYPPMPLKVALDADNCGICSDGGDDYIDGVDGVSAVFDQYGNFIFSTQTTRTKIRSLIYEYSAFNPSAPPMPISGSNHYMATLRVEPGVGLQVLPVGESQRQASCPIYDDDNSAFEYRHGFYRDCQRGLGPEGSALIITRTSGTTWEVVPEGTAVAQVFHLLTKGRTAPQDDGMLDLPFKMVLTTK